MKYLPLFFNAADKRCLIVGGGAVATRRAAMVLPSGAKIDVVGVTLSAAIRDVVMESKGSAVEGEWQGDISGSYDFVIAATNDKTVNQQIAAAARAQKIPVNVATDATLCDFVFPATIDRDPITIAVSSGSASPILARLLAERIDASIPAGYGKLGQLVRKYRKRVRQAFSSAFHRKRFWEKALRGSIAETVFSGNLQQAEAMLEQSLTEPVAEPAVGEVYLIGAGPGDPDLLTFRAFRLLQQAEVVLYDRLVSQQILDQISPDVEKVYVGKRRADHAVPQPAINQQLVDYAVAGKRVARLKGGDPFIFGRGGEEIELLAQHRIPFQVIPGITAAAGCASYAGIPLTHRDHAQSVRFVTGQLQDGTVNLPWAQLVAPGQTLVIYMGLVGLPVIAENLIAHGLSSDTPAAMIEQGTTLEQKVHCSTIRELPAIVETRQVKAPTLMIIGTVVSLHNKLNWFQGAEY